MSSIEKKTNFYDLEDESVNLQTKLSTFESNNQHIKTQSLIPKILRDRIQGICEKIVEHINTVMGMNKIITTLELVLKVDRLDNLWLLFCTRIKIRDKNSQNASFGDVSLMKANSIRSNSILGNNRRKLQFREGLIATIKEADETKKSKSKKKRKQKLKSECFFCRSKIDIS